METFEHELSQLINKYSEENQSNTPDFILAHYLASCLDIFNFALIQRTKWYQPLAPKQYSFFKSYNNF